MLVKIYLENAINLRQIQEIKLKGHFIPKKLYKLKLHDNCR